MPPEYSARDASGDERGQDNPNGASSPNLSALADP